MLRFNLSFTPVKVAYATLLVSFLIGSTSYAQIVKSGGGPYQSGDWLINYSGGFVRRGLSGQLLNFIDLRGQVLLWVVYAIQTLLFALIFLYFGFLASRYPNNWLVVSLICSPAAISFYGWDPFAFGRKEVILYFSLVLLSLAVRLASVNELKAKTFLISGLTVYIFGIFCWEPIFLGTIGVLLLTIENFNTLQFTKAKRRVLSSVLILVSAAAFVLNALFKGSPQVAHEICLSLRYKEISKNDFCNGAIAALGWSFDYTLQTVRSSYPLYLWYAPLIFLATIVFLSLKMLRRIRAFMILNTFSFFPLFVVVNDYGRWISMIVITNILILFAFEKEFPLKWRWRANGNDPKFGVTSCVYVLFWGIPHYAEPRYGFPIVNPILSIGKFLQHILNLF